jgi:hypothetical protein
LTRFSAEKTMTLAHSVALDRAERVGIGRVSTFRDESRIPTDVLIKNLSQTGCLFQYDAEVPVGALISIGLADLGVHSARVVRVQDHEYGCEFLAPIGDADLATALAGKNILQGSFEWAGAPAQGPMVQVAGVQSASSSPAESAMRLPIRHRVAIIVGGTLLLWGIIIGAAGALIALSH